MSKISTIFSHTSIKDNLISGIEIDNHIALQNLLSSPSITTALLPFTGYNKAAELAQLMKNKNLNIFEANKRLNLIDENKLEKILSPQFLLKTGFTLNDLD